MLLSFQAAHDPIQTPPGWSDVNTHIADHHRRELAGLVSHLDAAIGRVVDHARMALGWESMLFMYCSDNGGVPYLGSSNYPWRGAKGTVWEGGVRTQLLVGGGALLPRGASVPTSVGASPHRIGMLAHITDLFPTILAAAAANAESGGTAERTGSARDDTVWAPPLDGFDLWPHLMRAASGATLASTDGPRREVLINVDDVGYPLLPVRHYPSLRQRLRRTLARKLGWADRSAALRHGKFKLVVGIPGAPYASSPLSQDTQEAASSMSAAMAGSVALAPPQARHSWPTAARLDDLFPGLSLSFRDWEQNIWLFDLESDPGERVNLLLEGTASDAREAERLLQRIALQGGHGLATRQLARHLLARMWRQHVEFLSTSARRLCRAV